MTGLFGKSPEKIAKRKAILKKKELKSLFKQKRYGQVLKVGEEILKTIPDDLDVLFIVGGIHNMRGKHKTAISYFDRILDISSYDPDALLLKARSSFELGKYDDSGKCCNKILEIDPKNSSVKELLGKISSKRRPQG